MQRIDTLPEPNELPLKMDGWNTSLSYWGGLFSGAMLVSGRVSQIAMFERRYLFKTIILRYILPKTNMTGWKIHHELSRCISY